MYISARLRGTDPIPFSAFVNDGNINIEKTDTKQRNILNPDCN